MRCIKLATYVSDEEAHRLTGKHEEIARDRLKRQLHASVDYIVDHSTIQDEYVGKGRAYSMKMGVDFKD